MRITLESTVSEPQYSIKCVVEVPYDDLSLLEFQELIDQALRGYGFVIEPEEQVKVVKTAGR